VKHHSKRTADLLAAHIGYASWIYWALPGGWLGLWTKLVATRNQKVRWLQRT